MAEVASADIVNTNGGGVSRAQGVSKDASDVASRWKGAPRMAGVAGVDGVDGVSDAQSSEVVSGTVQADEKAAEVRCDLQ